MPKGTPTTLTHAGNVSTGQRTRNVTSIPIRQEPIRQNRPNSRGTPSRASNNSRGARASEDRTGRSFDDTEDHLRWLSIPAIEGDAQSFQSVTLDSMQQQEMANLVERQRINANRRPMKLRVPSQSELSPHNSSHETNFPVHFERQVTTSTEGLSDITLESDDGVGSDRTTTAFYMNEKGSPSRDHVAIRLKNMTDDEISYLENFIRAEKQRRMQQYVDPQAVEARKQIRRSKSGGSDGVFTRKHMSSPGSALERKASGELSIAFGSLRLGSYEGQEPEDPEVRSLFCIQENSPAVTVSQPSPYGVRVLSSSRGGALHPGEKMFDPKLHYSGSTPSPATTNAASNSHANSAIHFMHSPTQQLQSPIQDSHHSSRPGSRSASGGLASLLQINTIDARATTTVSATTASTNAAINLAKPANRNSTAVFTSIDKEVEISKAKKVVAGHPSNTNRELVFSPSSAFDDISLGSQKSIGSSRSSRTRVFGENSSVGKEISSPSSTFSKHHNPTALAVGVKKTIQTTASSAVASDTPKTKSKKN